MSKYLRQMTALSETPANFKSRSEPAPYLVAIPTTSPTPPQPPDTPPSVAPGASGLGAPGLGAPGATAPEIDFDAFAYQEPTKPRPWTSVQDAHTHAEQVLYATMFSHAKPISGNTQARALVIGTRTLARLVPMAYSNCHSNLKSLMEKLAIEERKGAKHNAGRCFIVYTYEEILRRRRAAGFTSVLKRTRGVTLINPGAPELGAPGLGNSGAPGLGAHFIRKKEYVLGTSSSSSSNALHNAVERTLGHVDDDGVNRIISSARAAAPDLQDEELADLILEEGPDVRRLSGVQHPAAYLAKVVAGRCRGESFRRWRQDREQVREAQARRDREQRAEWQRILDDPRSDEQLRALARESLQSDQGPGPGRLT